MGNPTYYITDGEDFKGLVWETKIGRIITMEGQINPQMGFIVKDVSTGEKLMDSNMVDILAEILPFK